MKFLKIKKNLLTGILVSVLCIQSAFAITSSQVDNYRIRIHSTSTSATIKVNNGYSLYVDNNKVDYTIASGGEDITFTKNGNNIEVKSSKVLGTGSVIQLIKNDNAERYFEVKDIDSVAYAKYPDNVTLRLDSAKTNLLVINETPLETYLKGVIPHEMGASAPLEALKAQAITARTVAVKRVNKYNSDGYDITNTTIDQVYKGYNATYFSKTHNVCKAVDDTKGIVLTYNGALIEGLFYSNNGGMTASDGYVWSSGISTPYYKSKVDTYDTYLHKTTINWNKINYDFNYTKEELRDKIIASSTKYPAYFKSPYCTPAFNGLSENYNIEIISQVNGYITQIKLSDDTGRVYIIKNYATRWFFDLRSQQYSLTKVNGLFVKSSSGVMNKDSVFVKSASGEKVEVKLSDLKVKSSSGIGSVSSTRYIFEGKGYGHGIGMSQNGAMNRAEAGQSYKDILNFYYEGTTTVSNYGN